MKKIYTMIEISARHIHLSKKDKEKLFGKNYELKIFKKLSQASDFAAKEQVIIKYNNRKIKDVRVVGPERKQSQLEISKTDSRYLKFDAFIRLSGDLKGVSKIDVIGPKGKTQIAVIIAKRHLHISDEEANQYGLNSKKQISIFVKNKYRPLTFHNVIIRKHPDYKLAMHIDTDEGNAADLSGNSKGKIISK